jgi:hypothetical protein
MIWEFVIGPVAVALIGGPFMVVFRRFDRRNTEQHGENLNVLKSIEGKIEKLDSRMDDHIEWHMTKKDR